MVSARVHVLNKDEASVHTADGLQLNFRRCDASDTGEVYLSPASGGMLISKRQAKKILKSFHAPPTMLDPCGHGPFLRRMCANLSNITKAEQAAAVEAGGEDDGGSVLDWGSVADDMVGEQ